MSGYSDIAERCSPISPTSATVHGMAMTSGHHRLRIGRVSLPGQIYLVTFCTQGRRPLFADLRVASTAVVVLRDAHWWKEAKPLAWVLMPDHWHGLIQLRGTAQLSRVIGRLKGGSAHRLGALFPDLRPVWQPAFHDHALRRDEDVPDCVRYLLDNPVRAGLASSAQAYPHRGGDWLDAYLRDDSG